MLWNGSMQHLIQPQEQLTLGLRSLNSMFDMGFLWRTENLLQTLNKTKKSSQTTCWTAVTWKLQRIIKVIKLIDDYHIDDCTYRKWYFMLWKSSSRQNELYEYNLKHTMMFDLPAHCLTQYKNKPHILDENCTSPSLEPWSLERRTKTN